MWNAKKKKMFSRRLAKECRSLHSLRLADMRYLKSFLANMPFTKFRITPKNTKLIGIFYENSVQFYKHTVYF